MSLPTSSVLTQMLFRLFLDNYGSIRNAQISTLPHPTPSIPNSVQATQLRHDDDDDDDPRTTINRFFFFFLQKNKKNKQSKETILLEMIFIM